MESSGCFWGQGRSYLAAMRLLQDQVKANLLCGTCFVIQTFLVIMLFLETAFYTWKVILKTYLFLKDYGIKEDELQAILNYLLTIHEVIFNVGDVFMKNGILVLFVSKCLTNLKYNLLYATRWLCRGSSKHCPIL